MLVPAGWDSWGKIRILRDRYDAELVGSGWEADMEPEKNRLAGDEGGVQGEGEKVVGAHKMYEDFIVDLDENDSVRSPSTISGFLLTRNPSRQIDQKELSC